MTHRCSTPPGPQRRPFHQLRRHRRRRQVQPRREPGRAVPQPGQGGDGHARAGRHAAGREAARPGAERGDGRADRSAADVRGAARPPAAGDRAGAGARRRGAVRPLHRCHVRLPGRRPRLRSATCWRRWSAGCSRCPRCPPARCASPQLTLWFDLAPEIAAAAAGGRAPARQVRVAAAGVLPQGGRRLRGAPGGRSVALCPDRCRPAARRGLASRAATRCAAGDG